MPAPKRKPAKPKPKPKLKLKPQPTPQPTLEQRKAALIAQQKASRHQPRCPICGSPAGTTDCINPSCPA